MKINYAEYLKKTDASVLVAEAIFSDLELNYPKKLIVDVADTTSGGTPLRSNAEYYGGEIPWLKSGELNDGIIKEAEEFITEKGLKNSSAKLLPINTLLLAMYGATAGRTGITNLEAATNQAVCALFPKEEIDQGYLFWFLRQHRFKFIEISKGGAQPNISQSVINKTNIPLPDKSLQIEIANLLFDLEAKGTIDITGVPHAFRGKVNKVFTSKNNVLNISDELTHQLNLVKKLRQQLLQDAIQGKLLPQNPDDEPASVLLQKIKAEKEQLIKEKKLKKEKDLAPIKPEEIPFEIPDNWVWCRLGEICNYGTSQKAEPKNLNNDTWILDLEDIEKDTSKLLFKIRFKERKSLSTKSIFKKGQVLYSKLRPYLDKLIVSDEDGVCTTEILPLNFYGHINPYYSMFTLKSRHFLNYVNSVTKGMKMPRLGTNEGRKSLIPLPPLSEQFRIVQKTEQLMALFDALEASIKQSRQQNEQLLQQVLREALTQRAGVNAV